MPDTDPKIQQQAQRFDRAAARVLFDLPPLHLKALVNAGFAARRSSVGRQTCRAALAGAHPHYYSNVLNGIRGASQTVAAWLEHWHQVELDVEGESVKLPELDVAAVLGYTLDTEEAP